MDNEKKKLSDAAAVAQFKLALIAPVIHGLYPDASRNAYYQRITEKLLTLPDGSVFQYSPKTISKWVSLYQNGGIEALMPQERSDKGSSRVLPDTAIEEIFRLKETFPRLNATQIHRYLVAEAFGAQSEYEGQEGFRRRCFRKNVAGRHLLSSIYNGSWQPQEGILHHDH